MEFIHIDGEDKPMIIYKPYIYATIYDCNVCYAIVKGNNIQIVEKENKKKKKGK